MQTNYDLVLMWVFTLVMAFALTLGFYKKHAECVTYDDSVKEQIIELRDLR